MKRYLIIFLVRKKTLRNLNNAYSSRINSIIANILQSYILSQRRKITKMYKLQLMVMSSSVLDLIKSQNLQ